jgi:hypothetical protein
MDYFAAQKLEIIFASHSGVVSPGLNMPGGGPRKQGRLWQPICSNSWRLHLPSWYLKIRWV